MTVWRKRWTRIARKPLRIACGAGALARVAGMFLLITPGFLNPGSCSRNLARCKMTVRDRYTPPRSKTMREKIRAAIRAVPRGKVSTYGAVARAAGYPRGARQVVQTLRHSVGLPWHRILGAGGEIKLHGDSAVEQRLRLQTEGVTFRGRRVDMKSHQHVFGRTRRKGT
jgi:methylated-DNA-protein-cysteine methyltransferase related protein